MMYIKSHKSLKSFHLESNPPSFSIPKGVLLDGGDPDLPT